MKQLRFLEPRPVSDGRDINSELGLLPGEAAGQKVTRQSGSTQVDMAWEQLPEPSPEDPTYYDRPILKAPVWKLQYIPTYYYVGGLAGASLALGAAAQLDPTEELNPLIRRCHWIGIIGSSIGAALLIADLGLPTRFLYMLRVFRPTSAMNMGAWLLAIAPTAAVTAGLFARSEYGLLRSIGEKSGYVAGIFGIGLATYTGVLVAESAIPFWQNSRRGLPLLFGASAVASAGSMFDLLPVQGRGAGVARIYGIAGRVAEIAAARLTEHEVKSVPHVGKPLESGLTAWMWRGAELMTAVSLVVALLPNQTRRRQVVAGVLGTAGSLLMRYAVHQCGVRSSRDPKASFRNQRS